MKIIFAVLTSIFILHSCTSKNPISNGTIYKTDRNKRLIDSMYDAKLAAWPVKYEIVEVNTKFGKTSIIACGNLNSPPVFLIHPMGVTATVWLPNVEELSKSYRLYAINTIGDIGRSELYNIYQYPKNGREYSDWLNEVADFLKIDKVDLIGGSMGGWISMNYAIHSTMRVKHLILLGPMGIKANTFGVMRRLMKVLANPSEKNKKELAAWAIGDNESVKKQTSEYLNIAMNCEGRMAIPKRISKDNLKRIKAKTLLVLGEKDNPIGKPERNIRFAKKYIDNIEFKTNKCGHLINVEEPDSTNSLILEFLKR